MSSIAEDIYSESDINFLQNEKFDFDLPFSPTNVIEGIVVDEDDEDDEVFFGDVGFTEQCMSTRVASLQEDEHSLVKPLSPLSGEQVVELFTEATKLALHIEKLSTDASESNHSNSYSGSTTSTSSSYLHSSSTSSYLPLRKSSSDDSMPEKSKQCIEVPQVPDDGSKENVDPVTPAENTIMKHGTVGDGKKSKITGAILAPKQLNSPVQKIKNGLSRIGSAKRTSRLPRSKNTEKSTSAFSSPIRAPQPRFSNGSTENISLDDVSDDNMTNMAGVAKKSARETRPQSKGPVSSTKKDVITQQSTPASSTRNKKSTTPALTKRNIFRSSETLNDHGTKNSKSKLPISGLSKIPGVLSRRRRSNSTSSVSSQSSTSSQTTTTAQDEDAASKLTNKNQPCTKPSLTSSITLFRRSSKTKLENGVEKKAQPVKALPPMTHHGVGENKSNTVSVDVTYDKVKIPLSVGTPVRESQSSLPIKRRSSIKKPNTTGKKMIPQSLPKQKSNEHETPRKSNGKIVTNVANRKARRSLLPTPSRDASTRSRLPTDGGTTMIIPMKLAEPMMENGEENRSNSSDLMKATDSSDEGFKCHTQSTVDDLLQLDTTTCMVNGIVPMQPNPIPQANLIDLADI